MLEAGQRNRCSCNDCFMKCATMMPILFFICVYFQPSGNPLSYNTRFVFLSLFIFNLPTREKQGKGTVGLRMPVFFFLFVVIFNLPDMRGAGQENRWSHDARFVFFILFDFEPSRYERSRAREPFVLRCRFSSFYSLFF